MTDPAEAPSPTKIVFGTDGWRAKIGDEYTFENVRRLAEGVARVVEEDGAAAKSVVIAYDRRFGSEEFAIAAAEILLAHGIPVAYSRTDVPTQMASYEVVMRGAAMGVVITASHNPWMDNGFKVKESYGSSSPPAVTRAIEDSIDGIAAANGVRREHRMLEALHGRARELLLAQHALDQYREFAPVHAGQGLQAELHLLLPPLDPPQIDNGQGTGKQGRQQGQDPGEHAGVGRKGRKRRATV